MARLAVHRVPGGGVEVTADTRRGLLEWLALLPDPRGRRGGRHRLVGILAVAVCAVLAGARSLAAIAEWTLDASPAVLAELGLRPDPLTGQVVPPGEATIRRVLTAIDADAVDEVVGAWLRGLRPPGAQPVGGTGAWRAVAVDGKSVRGSGPPGGQVHLLAAVDHEHGTVLGQVQVDGKSNEITALRPLSTAEVDWRQTIQLQRPAAQDHPASVCDRLEPGPRLLQHRPARDVFGSR